MLKINRYIMYSLPHFKLHFNPTAILKMETNILQNENMKRKKMTLIPLLHTIQFINLEDQYRIYFPLISM